MVLARIPVDLTWTGATGSPGVNVWHGRFLGAVAPFDDLEGLTTMLNTFYATIAPIFPATMSCTYAGVAYGVGANAEEEYTSPAWTVEGDAGADFLAPALAMYVNWSTGSGGRNGRGRTFLGPLGVSSAEGNGTPAEGLRGTVQGAVDALVSASLTDANGALGVFSRVDGVLRDFTAGAVPNKFAVLRSRRD